MIYFTINNGYHIIRHLSYRFLYNSHMIHPNPPTKNMNPKSPPTLTTTEETATTCRRVCAFASFKNMVNSLDLRMFMVK